jgi:3-phytase
MQMRIAPLIAWLLLIGMPACWQVSSDYVVIKEAFVTRGDKADNIDSVAVWHGKQGQHWLIVTAKSTDKLCIYDAATGDAIKTIGSSGTGPQQFKRPNGIAVQDDLLFVVERDNKRLQILHLPTMQLCGLTHGDLQRPYGVAVVQIMPRLYHVYITDNPGDKKQNTPKKVYQYRVERAASGCSITLERIFGDNDGPGALWKVESIAADPAYNRLYIADEHKEHKNIKIYTMDGQFTGQTIGDGEIQHEPEGIALYASDDLEGYIVATDQDHDANTFLIYDRATLAHKGAFRGAVVRNTDGIAITPRAFGPFAYGALYAVHDDGGIGAFDWATIVEQAVQRDRLHKDHCD